MSTTPRWADTAGQATGARTLAEPAARERVAAFRDEPASMLVQQVSEGYVGNADGGPADLLATALNAGVIFLGRWLPADHWHPSDESVDIERLLRGTASIAHLWDEPPALEPKDRR